MAVAADAAVGALYCVAALAGAGAAGFESLLKGAPVTGAVTTVTSGVLVPREFDALGAGCTQLV